MAAGRPPRRRLAVAGDPPVGTWSTIIAAARRRAPRARQDLVDEVAQAAGEVAAHVAFERAPLALLLIELRAVARQPEVHPASPPVRPAPCSSPCWCGGAVVQRQEDLPPGRLVPRVQGFQIRGGSRPSPGRREHLDPSPPQTSTPPKTVSRRFVPAAGTVGGRPLRCQTRPIGTGWSPAASRPGGGARRGSGSARHLFPPRRAFLRRRRLPPGLAGAPACAWAAR